MIYKGNVLSAYKNHLTKCQLHAINKTLTIPRVSISIVKDFNFLKKKKQIHPKQYLG